MNLEYEECVYILQLYAVKWVSAFQLSLAFNPIGKRKGEKKQV